MNLTFEQLRCAALGAAYLTEAADGVHFHRFTAAQEAVYGRQGHPMPLKARATAGVALSFRTDSTNLRLQGTFQEAWSRDYCSLDVTVDGRYLGSVDNFSHLTIPKGDYTEIRCLRGGFAKEFRLGPGEKTVKLYFPWSAEAVLEAVTLTDGSTFVPVRPKRKILFYGDSITQGYDALRPMNSYASRVADALNMEQVNKANGGEMFNADLTAEAEVMDPALVIVAWGTNNWGLGTREHLLEHAPRVFRNLRGRYPNAPMYAIVPIWRGDQQPDRTYGSFAQLRQDVRQIAEAAGVTVIDGYDLIPHEPEWFGDLRLHPNDAGFEKYAENLLNAIKK